MRLYIIVALFAFSSCFMPVCGADLSVLTPEDSSVVVNFKVGKIFGYELLKKELFRTAVTQLTEDKRGPVVFGALFVMDVLKQLDEVSVFILGKELNISKKPDFGVLLRTTANFSKHLDEIRAFQKEFSASVLGKFEGMDCLSEEPGRKELLLVVDENTLFFGTSSAARSLAAVKNASSTVKPDTKIQGLLKKADTGALIWGVGQLPAEVCQMAASTPQTAPLASITALFMSVNFQEDIALSAAAEVSGKECLESVSVSLNGFLALSKLTAGGFTDVIEILNTAKIESLDSAVKVSVKLPIKNIEGLLKMMAKKAEKNFDAEKNHYEKSAEGDEPDKDEKQNDEKSKDEKPKVDSEEDPNSDVEIDEDNEED
ncbi:MAG: hypothetical protein HQM10_04980 [Candidatus Riflebacteria bacterium]|nr:hypothetical protein [Candidatus Riflebacteria bacterium]